MGGVVADLWNLRAAVWAAAAISVVSAVIGHRHGCTRRTTDPNDTAHRTRKEDAMGDRAAKDALYAEFAAVGKALGSPKRLELLDLLAQGPSQRRGPR